MGQYNSHHNSLSFSYHSLIPNSNITQSAPNINYGQRILNDPSGQNEIANANQYHNQINQAYNNLQNVQPNVMMNTSRINDIQNQTLSTNNYQEYQNTSQPTVNTIPNQHDNQYSQNHANQAYFNNVQNMSNQYSTQNGIIQNIPNKINQGEGHGKIAQEPKLYQQQNYISQPIENFKQENPYQNTLEQPQPETRYWTDPNVAYSQPQINSTNYMSEQQHQHIAQNKMVNPQQNYSNLNQQFENININNQYASNRNANYPAHAQYPPYDTQPTNTKMLSETQVMYQDPKTVIPTQQEASTAYIQGNNAGDYVTSNLHSGAENNQNQWDLQHLVKIPQYETYNGINSNLNMGNTMIQNPQYVNDIVKNSQSGVAQYNPPPADNIPMITPQLHIQDPGRSIPQTEVNNQNRLNVVEPPHIQSNQQLHQVRHIAQDNINRQPYQNNVGVVEPHMQSSQSNQQFKSIEQHNLRKYASNPVVHSNNTNPSYIPSNQNVYEQGMPAYNYNVRNSATNPISQMSSDRVPQQVYNPQNQNIATNQFIPSQQNIPLAQPTYSAGYLPTSAHMQVSRHNIPSDSYSAANMPQRYINQNNIPVMNNVHAEGRNNKNGEINGIAQGDVKEHQDNTKVENSG
ncbi:hypothetical protein NQ314_015914 [Rhamnusium bicolor]|uniref:Uncharacterized protein n=1 Tax=Rhamnusium bicolor TaxID=1586634 RepID=A0AAV8WXH8_9CUCU|nr:hypothetical protein NQ314_015914 [Rhamnusium bicolor]